MMNLGGNLFSRAIGTGLSRVSRTIVCVPEPAISDNKGVLLRNAVSSTTTD